MNKIKQAKLVEIIEESLVALDKQSREKEASVSDTTDRMVLNSFKVGWLRSLVDKNILPALKDKS